jgi:hypothetical protein
MKSQIYFLFFLLPVSVMGQSHTARIVKLENKSEIFMPGPGQEGKHKTVKYMDKVYHVVPAEKGMKLDDGVIVTTAPDAKVKVIYNNGDHFFVSPNTQYKIEIQRKALDEGGRDGTVVTVMRGAVRGLVEKDGPRSGMKVVTKNAVMGIRGTDFQVKLLQGGITQVSVLRGQVEVKTDNADKPVAVETGQTLLKKEEEIKVAVLTQQELKEVAKESTIKASTAQASEEVISEIAELEKKASAVTLKDLKEYQPKIYEEIIASKKEVTSDNLAVATAEVMAKDAPVRRKPDWRDLDYNDDPYKKYEFKP